MSYLDEIMAWHRKSAKGKQDFAFSRALSKTSADFGVIAEIKRRSPSKGDLNQEIDPPAIAKVFESAGASCISVLTDEKFFGGSLEDLRQVKQAVKIPVLRKDFTVCVDDVFESAQAGADAVLLIMAGISDTEAGEFHAHASQLGMDTLFEVHTKAELGRVLEIYSGASPLCILVNQRDLHTFEEYPTRALELAEELANSSSLADETITIAASAIKSPEAVAEIKSAGYNGVLVGEYLMRAENSSTALQELLAGIVE